MSEEKRNDLGAALLAELARDPNSSCRREFEALFYEHTWRRLRQHHQRLSARISRYVGNAGASAPQLLPEEVDEVAHIATARALRRVCENAAKFDPNRGTASHWVAGNSEFAFVEVAKEIVASRRPPGIKFVGAGALLEIPDETQNTEEIVVAKLSSEQRVREAAELLSEREWQALRLVVTERYSYAEAAMIVFGTAEFTKQIDHLLTQAKKKLREAWPNLRPAGSGRGASCSNLQSEADDMEESDG